MTPLILPETPDCGRRAVFVCGQYGAEVDICEWSPWSLSIAAGKGWIEEMLAGKRSGGEYGRLRKGDGKGLLRALRAAVRWASEQGQEWLSVTPATSDLVEPYRRMINRVGGREIIMDGDIEFLIPLRHENKL